MAGTCQEYSFSFFASCESLNIGLCLANNSKIISKEEKKSKEKHNLHNVLKLLILYESQIF